MCAIHTSIKLKNLQYCMNSKNRNHVIYEFTKAKKMQKNEKEKNGKNAILALKATRTLRFGSFRMCICVFTFTFHNHDKTNCYQFRSSFLAFLCLYNYSHSHTNNNLYACIRIRFQLCAKNCRKTIKIQRNVGGSKM